LIHGGLSALWSYHFSSSRISPPTPAQNLPLGWTGLLPFQPLALPTKRIDIAQHPV
jgi:hypothetical protein